MTRSVLLVGLLAAIYAVIVGSGDPADVLAGAIAGAGTLALTRQLQAPPQDAPSFASRIAWFFPWALVVAREIAAGTWEVARVSAFPGRAPRAGIVAIPIGERTEQGVAVSALAATLSPGEVLVDVDRERRAILLHVLDATDPDAVRERHQRIYERYQSRVFP